jgi:hypothetical protein
MSSIVWMASYPKSGNTWVRAFLQNFLSNGDQPADINALDEYFADESKPNWYQPLVERAVADLSLQEICELRPVVQKNIAASRDGSVFVKTHNILGAYNGLPLHDMSVTAGAIYIVRNPLDVVLSVADHFGLSIEDAIVFMNSKATGSPNDQANVGSVLTSWSDHVTSWTADKSATCVLHYETHQIPSSRPRSQEVKKGHQVQFISAVAAPGEATGLYRAQPELTTFLPFRQNEPVANRAESRAGRARYRGESRANAAFPVPASGLLDSSVPR